MAAAPPPVGKAGMPESRRTTATAPTPNKPAIPSKASTMYDTTISMGAPLLGTAYLAEAHRGGPLRAALPPAAAVDCARRDGPPAAPTRRRSAALEPRMQLNRRTFLTLGAAAAAVAAAGVGGVGITLFRWWDQPAEAGFRYLSPDEAAFVRAYAEAAFPSTEAVPFAPATAGLDHFIDAALESMPSDIGKALRTLLHAMDASTLPTEGAHFSALSVDARAATLLGWMNADDANLRGIGDMLTLIVGMGYTSHPTVAPFFRAMHGCAFGLEYGS